jgi:DNA-nicking Smr family endonuclease
MKSPVLTDLKKNLREAPIVTPVKKPAPVPKPIEEDIDEATLFARATQGVRRMATDPVVVTQRPKPTANTLLRRAAAVADETSSSSPISDTAALMHTVSPEEALSYARSGVQPKALQKLKQGLSPWQAAVDLHGCTIDTAREAVLSLLENARKEGLNIVKIVHGKGLQNGQPLLKTCVNGWLRQLPGVLAFVSCTPRDGGTGAVYVLLKKTRQNSDEAPTSDR